MKKYFVISDVHSFFTEMRRDLHRAGFRKANPDHILILIGDMFDRGPGSKEVYEYIRSLPRERRILIRGNHELLLRNAINRGVFYDTDYYNGTLATVLQFTGAEYVDCVYDPESVCKKFKELGIIDWIFGPEWQDYAELGNYIFVHSWIPVKILDGTDIYDAKRSTEIAYRPDWREASKEDWEEATWGCPWVMAEKNLIPRGYTIVCGHWATSEFPKNLDKNHKNYPNHNIYRGHGCIALDATTVRSGFVNVLVLTEEELHEPKGSK